MGKKKSPIHESRQKEEKRNNETTKSQKAANKMALISLITYQ